MEKKLTYETAVTKLANIVSELEKNTLDIDQVSKQLQEAQKLLKFCKERLGKVEQDINKILEDE
ncbi:MAG: exodeoxyribonuclease VII small subunit [Bacteroidaceae bacterium]|nr:exodeoxyribonuclease VII small subunit [Bacteroidaceae bacterium]